MGSIKETIKKLNRGEHVHGWGEFVKSLHNVKENHNKWVKCNISIKKRIINIGYNNSSITCEELPNNFIIDNENIQYDPKIIKYFDIIELSEYVIKKGYSISNYQKKVIEKMYKSEKAKNCIWTLGERRFRGNNCLALRVESTDYDHFYHKKEEYRKTTYFNLLKN